MSAVLHSSLWDPELSLTTILFGPPRKILLLIFWDVGDKPVDQYTVSLVISVALLLITVWIYTGFAAAGCGKRSLAGQRAALKQASRLPAQGNGVKSVGGGSPMVPPDALWTVHNKRYDLRSFVSRHPGGVDAICLGQGHNCTELFESYHSLSNETLVRMTLTKYYVEDAPEGAIDYEARFDWNRTPFYDALKTRVRAHFAEKHSLIDGHRATFLQWLQLASFIAASGCTLCGFMCGKFLPMLLLPFCYWLGPSSCMHDGGHFSLSRYPWVNRLLAHLGGAHQSLFCWYHQHTIGHHANTNMPGLDPDLYHFTMLLSSQPGFRTSPELCPLPEKIAGYTRSRWWRMGFKLRVPLTTFGPSIIWDMNSLMAPDLAQAFMGLIPYRPKWMDGLFLHSVGRSMVIWLAIIHPITVSLVTASNWLSGAFYAVLFVVVPYAIHGCIFYVFSQVSHIQKECFRECSNGHPEEPVSHGHLATPHEVEVPSQVREWAIQQVEHTVDYAVSSTFWLHISVGLNLQAVHHLFPQIGWGHYTELAPIIHDVCAQFNVKYTTKPSFWEACASHYRYLVDINEGPNASSWICDPVNPNNGLMEAGRLFLLGQFNAPTQKTL